MSAHTHPDHHGHDHHDHGHRAHNDAPRSPSMAEARAAFEVDAGTRGGLVDALLAHAGSQIAASDFAGALQAVDEVDLHLPHADWSDANWRIRGGAAMRLRIDAAQRGGRHDMVLAIIDNQISRMPDNVRAADEAKLQLITTGLRSRIAIGDVDRATTDIELSELLLTRLANAIPERPAAALRASLKLDRGGIALLRGESEGADGYFGEGLGILDRLGGSEFKELRQHLVQTWVRALNAQGRKDEATALLLNGTSRPFAPVAHHHHGEDCDCFAH